uniref:Peptidase A1 domain-containing protein n=1 Tax=Kalanchoe fedtschenkoi TaxID=63787 RepID=A0A7N0TB21_KALFE
MVHKNGPCSKLGSSLLSAAQRLELDQARARSIQSTAATSPAKDGAVVAAAGDFVVTLGLGTPRTDVSLIVDTASNVVWTQCKPCTTYCYKQKTAVFDPFSSKTYENVSCERSSCGIFTGMAGMSRDCAAGTCSYAMDYSDKSFSKGFFALDVLTVGSDSLPEFYFGCGQENKGHFGGAAGILGLGRDTFSAVVQTEEKYGKVFSYCLPSKLSYVGRLSFGKGGVSKSVKYTPLVTRSARPSTYLVEMVAISVGGVKLAIPAKVLSAPGTVIDSGTAISRLPPSVYQKLSAAFRHQMVKYRMAKPLGILDTCYDLRGYKYVSVPKISLFFKGGLEVPLHSSGVLFGNGVGRMCLAFAASESDSGVSILGNVQQQTLEVVFDVRGGKIGFGVNGCS